MISFEGQQLNLFIIPFMQINMLTVWNVS